MNLEIYIFSEILSAFINSLLFLSFKKKRHGVIRKLRNRVEFKPRLSGDNLALNDRPRSVMTSQAGNIYFTIAITLKQTLFDCLLD